MKTFKQLNQSSNLQRSAVSRACLSLTVLLAGAASAPLVHAGAGWGDSFDSQGQPIRVPTFYAHSPSGMRGTLPADNLGNVPATANGGYTGKALRKFVDPLAPLGLGAGLDNKLSDNSTSKYIPIAVAEKWVRPDGTVSGDDYFEIAVVEYTEKLHSDLKKATTLRGYVQLWTPRLKDSSGNAIVAKNFTLTDGTVIQVVDKPHYLGPAIVATKGVPTRLKFVNLLPVGHATGSGSSFKRNGDLFIPVDETLAGAGVGPDGLTRYTQNRASVHLHGGDTPWISDGTPHQWIAPAGELPLLTAEMAASGSTESPATFMRGASTQNVPDMPDPGPGAMTYYFPNGQSGRLMWYHDHAYGLTRLNAYSGMAAPYVLTDSVQDALLTNAGVPGVAETIPLVIQDKTFVPDDIGLQDARWNMDVNGNAVPAWGTPGDLWYPHVYEVNQDPSNGIDGTNPVGRWDWGPYFWPVFPALYNVPSGAVGDVTITPEAWMDTPLVNGVAYPKLDVQPKTYRFRILNGANDRFMNLSLFVADSAVSTIEITNGGTGYNVTPPVVTLSPPTGTLGAAPATVETVVDPVTGAIVAINVLDRGVGYDTTPTVTITGGDGNATAVARANTEVKMVPAVPQIASGLPSCVGADGIEVAPTLALPCWPTTWPTDGRVGGVPDPAYAGPSFVQIASEGGLLPAAAVIPPTPMGYEYNRRSITVLNTENQGLFLSNAERADVLVDFSQYAGKTVILYSDAPAPVPAFDPRNDHYTDKPDETGTGGSESTKPGYGPNTRTVMQFNVAAGLSTNPTLIATATAELPRIYAATQERPIVAQSAYNNSVAVGGVMTNPGWSDFVTADGSRAYASIFLGSLQEPTFKFTPGTPGVLFSSISVTNGGSGYITPPAVNFPAPPTGGVQATATATLKISDVQVTNPGSGYLIAPAVRFNTTTAGSGATALAFLKVVGTTITAGGSGYTARPTVTFSAPTGLKTGGALATGTATVSGGRVTGITITNPGVGYAGRPTVTISGGGGTGAKATTVAGVGLVKLIPVNPNLPNLTGGGAYTDMSLVTVGFSLPPTGGTTPAATVTGSVFDITFVNPGSGYTTLPITVDAPPAGVNSQNVANSRATATALSGGSMLVKTKAIQELFDPTYGRMNATLGIEVPFTSALAQTTVPLGYVDPVSEEISNGETQIWKITHNGVDSHPVHFHLYNVQVINRIGWDGTVKPPHANELGWKETVRMNPLEDIVVAIKAKTPTLGGFGLPLSSRARDPSQPLGTPTGFTQVDPLTGTPATIVNEISEYGWEYVWHCHILGHEENDFMRPVKFNANEAIPAAPTGLTYVQTGNSLAMTWTDASTTEYQYQVQRVTVTNGVDGAVVPVATLLANTSSYTDAATPTPTASNSYRYEVLAVGASGTSKATFTLVAPLPAAPTLNTVTVPTARNVSLSWTNNSAAGVVVTNYLIEFSTNNGTSWNTLAQTLTNATTWTTTNRPLNTGSTYLFRVTAIQGTGGSAVSSTPSLTVKLVYTVPASPTLLAVGGIARVGTTNQDAVTLNWTAPVVPANGLPLTSYTVQYSSNNGGSWTSVTGTSAATSTAVVNVSRGIVGTTRYSFRILAVNIAGNSGNSNTTATVATL